MDRDGTAAKFPRNEPSAAREALRQAWQRAVEHHRAGRLAEAQREYRSILAVESAHFDALHMLGVAELQQRRFAQARHLIESALAIDERSADVHCHLGNALAGLGEYEQAIASYDRALTREPRQVNALANRGLALTRVRRYREALASCDAALALAPGLAEAHNNRGIALYHLGEHEAALASCDRALAIRPEFVEALGNRAVILDAMGRLDEALASCDRALAVAPAYAEAHFNRATTLQRLNRHAEALASFERALSLEPRLAELHASGFVAGSILHARMHCCDWRDYERSFRDLVAEVRAGRASAPPLTLVALSPSAEDQLRCARIWVREKLPAGAASWTGRLSFQPGERLRVGFVTWNLRDHPTMHLSLEFWEKIDRRRLEMFLYALRPSDENPFERRAR
ncbi:MAG TPA: tetratricopeptide repeat protein, partial [Casimicrobiaceae bacterium]|nr:tetratricopeptide repeat protein [Casimicrobiaceae bacterium]